MLQPIAWIVLALVHMMPAIAFFRPATLTALYGIRPDDRLFLLMHHRAGLFLAVFALCLWAASKPEARQAAGIVTAISMVTFLWLYWRSGAPAPLRTIALVDLAGLPFLVVAMWGAFRPT
jgi:hypothetical protein